MLIRPMTRSDATEVAELCAQLGYPAGEEQIARRFTDLEGDDNQGLFVAEEPGEGVVGWVHVFGSRLLEHDPVAEIGGLVVDGSWRGRGIGRALMEEAESWALERGHREVRVRSNVVRTEAHKFYGELGYTLVKTQHTLHKTLPAAKRRRTGR